MTEVVQDHIEKHILNKSHLTSSSEITVLAWRLTIKDINGPAGDIWVELENNSSDTYSFTETDEVSTIVEGVLETIQSSFVNIGQLRESISYMTIATSTQSIMINIRFPLLEAQKHIETLFFQSTRDNEETAQLHAFEYFVNLELLDIELDTENPEIYDQLHNPRNSKSPPYRITAYNTPKTIQQTVNSLVEVLLGQIQTHNPDVELTNTMIQIHPLSNEYDTFLETRANISLDTFEKEAKFNLL